MEIKQTYFLVNDGVKDNCLNFIKELPTNKEKPLAVEVKPRTRSIEQNAKLHALIGEVAKQKTYMGKPRSILTWKAIFVSGHNIASGNNVEMGVGLEGEVLNLRESTASMSVKRMISLIEYIQAWAVQNGVMLRDWERKYNDDFNGF